MARVLFSRWLSVIILLGLFSVPVTYGQRTVKELKSITKGCETTDVLNFKGMGGNAFYKLIFFSLHDVNNSLLNETEKELLTQYADVLVGKRKKKFYYCYFVLDSAGKVGVYDLNGNQLVAPQYGKIHSTIYHGLIIGDIAYPDDNTWIQKYIEASYAHDGRGVGYFQAAIEKANKEKIHVSIPAGKYEGLQLSIKFSCANPHYYVSRTVNDTVRWGVIDKKGKEVIPCKYLSVYKNNYFTNLAGNYVGSNASTMEEANKLVAEQTARMQQSMQALAGGLSAVGGALMTASTVVGNSQGTTTNTYSTTSTNTVAKTSSTSTKSTSPDAVDATNKNAASKAYTDWETQLIKMNTYYERDYNDAQRRYIQQQMKSIRQKWEQKGFNMYHSTWEDWDGKKK